jgi:hypothetical protein
MRSKAIALSTVAIVPLLMAAECQVQPVGKSAIKKCSVNFVISSTKGTKADINWLISDDQKGIQHKRETVPYTSPNFKCTKNTIVSVEATTVGFGVRTIRCLIYHNSKVVKRRTESGHKVTVKCKFEELVPPATEDA